jgi:hypothetical protein
MYTNILHHANGELVTISLELRREKIEDVHTLDKYIRKLIKSGNELN